MKTLTESAERYLSEDEITEAPKSGKKLLVIHMSKEVEEDNYEQGLIGKRQMQMDEKIGLTFDSFQDFKKHAEKFWYFTDDNSWSVIDDRLIYSRLENDNGDVVEESDPEFTQFKEGKINLWSADYEFLVKLIIEPSTSEDDIRDFTGIVN